MKRFRAGKSSRRVTFLRAVQTPDGGGGFEGTWQPQFSCWARFRRIYGGEMPSQAGTLAKQVQEVTIRAGSLARQVATDWRLDDHATGASFNIREIIVSEERGEVTLQCESGVPQ